MSCPTSTELAKLNEDLNEIARRLLIESPRYEGPNKDRILDARKKVLEAAALINLVRLDLACRIN